MDRDAKLKDLLNGDQMMTHIIRLTRNIISKHCDVSIDENEITIDNLLMIDDKLTDLGILWQRSPSCGPITHSRIVELLETVKGEI